jgi:phage gpG-like protein
MDIEFRTDFFQRLNKLNTPVFMRRLVNRSGVVAVNFSKERFVKKDWLDGASREKWKERKRRDRGSLMVKSGRLKRSIRKLSEGDYFVYVGTDVPYAQIHNEGGEVDKTANVRAHNRTRQARTERVKAHRRKMKFTMPKRQFLGDSDALAKRIERFAIREIDNEIQRL